MSAVFTELGTVGLEKPYSIGVGTTTSDVLVGETVNVQGWLAPTRIV